MVDEYQDINRIQYELIKHLAAGHRNLAVVGDDDQSVVRMAWGGCPFHPRLRAGLPEAKVLKLEQNYRSTQTILDADLPRR